jgi:acetyl-CoA carboxylase carboxyltransferase component
VIEPADMSSAPDWLPEGQRRLGSAIFYQAAVLHHLAGNREKAITRTKDWLAAIPAQNAAEKAVAQAQLSALTRPH